MNFCNDRDIVKLNTSIREIDNMTSLFTTNIETRKTYIYLNDAQ